MFSAGSPSPRVPVLLESNTPPSRDLLGVKIMSLEPHLDPCSCGENTPLECIQRVLVPWQSSRFRNAAHVWRCTLQACAEMCYVQTPDLVNFTSYTDTHTHTHTGAHTQARTHAHTHAHSVKLSRALYLRIDRT